MIGSDVSCRTRFRIAIVVLSGALLLLGPGIAATAGATSKAVHPQKAVTCTSPPTVTIGLNGTPNGSIYQDLGYTNFVGPMERLCHTVVNLEYFSSTTVTFAALLGGSVQYISTSFGSLMAALQQGTATNVVSLFTATQGGGSVFAAPIKDKSNGVGIKTLRDYANVTWGIPSAGGATAPYINQALKKDGVDPASIIKVVTGTGGEASLVNGKVGIVGALASQLEPAILSGQAFYIWSTFGLQAYQLTGLLPGAGLMTLSSTIQQYPQLTQQVTDVAVKNLLFIQKNVFHPKTVYNATTPGFQAITPYASFAQSWPLSRAMGIPVTGLMTQTGLQRTANIYYNNGVISGPVRISKGSVDTKFVDEAYKSMGLRAPTSQVNPKILYLLGDTYTGLQER